MQCPRLVYMTNVRVDIAACAQLYEDVVLVPPETDREADINGSDIVPAARWDIEHLSRMEKILLACGSGEVWEPCEVGRVYVYLYEQRQHTHSLSLSAIK